MLSAYSWPGNGRELRNVVERVVMLAASDTITAQDVGALLPRGGSTDLTPSDQSLYALPYTEAKEQAIEEFTKTYLRTKLSQSGNVITKAAESSGIPRQHFSLLMKRFLGAEDSEDL
jgi:two-component system nitrogen regulation response regulator NtrX